MPLLGICYGCQLIAQQLGGEVRRTGTGEYGRTELRIVDSSLLFANLPVEQQVWMSHGDSIVLAPPGFKTTASSGAPGGGARRPPSGPSMACSSTPR